MLRNMARQKDWQPDRRVSLAVAAASAVLLGVSFITLLRGARPGTNRAIMSLSLATAPKRQHRSERPAPRALASAAPRPTAPAVNPPTPDLRQALLDAARESAESMHPGVFLESPADRDSDLARALRAPQKPAVMQEGQSYRSLYGDTIAKTGGGCVSEQELQASPSPTNKVTVGFVVPCPGEYHPTMGDALSAWADKRKARQLLPP